MLALTYEELSLPALHKITPDPMRVEPGCGDHCGSSEQVVPSQSAVSSAGTES